MSLPTAQSPDIDVFMLTGGGLIWAGRGKLVPTPDTVAEAFHPEPTVTVPAEGVNAV